jgi:hypothetical protein
VTYEELVTRLTAAVDNRNTTPVTDGNAAEPDEGQAEAILERLVRAHGSPGGSSGTSDTGYAARLARWEDRLDQSYTAFDRAARALMTMVQARAARYPDTETDFRGTPIPVELRGAIYDAEIRAWNPETPVTVATGVAAQGYIGCLGRHARDVGIADAVIESARACGLDYDGARNSPVPTRRPPTPGVSSGLSYATATADAEAFVEYLDAI